RRELDRWRRAVCDQHGGPRVRSLGVPIPGRRRSRDRVRADGLRSPDVPLARGRNRDRPGGPAPGGRLAGRSGARPLPPGADPGRDTADRDASAEPAHLQSLLAFAPAAAAAGSGLLDRELLPGARRVRGYGRAARLSRRNDPAPARGGMARGRADAALARALRRTASDVREPEVV